MVATNQERVSRAFAILKEELEPFVVSALRRVDGEIWQRRMQDVLSRGDTPVKVHLDAAALLYIIWERWRDCFSVVHKFGYTEKSYVSELREARNKWAHQNGFDDDSAERTIDNVRRLMKAFGATNLQELVDLRNEVMSPSLVKPAVDAQPQVLPSRLAVADVVPSIRSPRIAHNHIDYVNPISAFLGEALLKKSISTYSSRDGSCRLVCAVSKQYDASGQIHYWFSFYPNQKDFLDDAKHAYVAYACGSPEKIVLVPYESFLPIMANLNTTTKNDRTHWHIEILQDGAKLLLRLAKGNRLDVSKFLPGTSTKK